MAAVGDPHGGEIPMELYARFGITDSTDYSAKKPSDFPVMSDFYDILMAQPEDEAKDIALSLELFVNGSLNIFNHQTNVDVDNRFTVYGIRDLGTELSPITMLVMMESIQNRIVENGKRGKATWL